MGKVDMAESFSTLVTWSDVLEGMWKIVHRWMHTLAVKFREVTEHWLPRRLCGQRRLAQESVTQRRAFGCCRLRPSDDEKYQADELQMCGTAHGWLPSHSRPITDIPSRIVPL